MNKTTTKNIDRHFSVTILSTFVLIVFGLLVLIGFNFYYGLNMWIGVIIYLFVVNIPFIVFTLFHILTLNTDSINNSTTRMIIHEHNFSVYKKNGGIVT